MKKEIRQLFSAVSKNNSGKVEKILARNIDVNAWDDHGFTALHYASIFGDVSTLAALLGHPQIDVEKLDIYGASPYAYASRLGRYHVCKLILARVRGSDALNEAIRTLLSRHP